MGDPSPPDGAQRKLVTVLVADVDEAVEGFADPDPEDVARLLAGQLARVRTEVEAFGGVVQETVGGRTVAVFGVPRTRDDDPERAVRAALAIRDTLTGAGAPPAGAAGTPQAGAAGAPPAAGPRVQAAVATGEALVRAGEGRQPGRQRVPGYLLAACARLQETGLAGAVLVTEATRRATERAIAYHPTPQVTLPGGVPAWSATATLGPGAGSRRAPRFPPLVARDAELGVLLEAAGRAAASGAPELVTVLGAAGIGKSRLLAELADRLAEAPQAGAADAPQARVPVAWRQGRSLPYGDDPSFGALAEAVKAEVGVVETDAAETAERRLAASVATAVADPATAAWVAGHLRRLVGIHPTPAGSPAVQAPTTAADREEEFAAWRRFLHGLAAARPLVLALEDLHRADDALLDFVESLAAPGKAALLVVATARPGLLERRPGWGSAGITIRLEPLGDADTTGLLAMLLAHHGLPTDVEPRLLSRVGGNPLFAEEYVRMLRDRGGVAAVHRAPPPTGALPLSPPDPLPTGVHAIVAARLDALPADERAVLHDAAVLGQVGWVGALGEVGGHPPDRLDACLARLEAKEFVQRFGRSSADGDAERAQLLLRLGRARCRSDMTGQDQLDAAREALLAAGQPLAAAEAEMLLGELAFLHGRGDQRAAHLDRALALVAGAPPSASKAAVLRGAMMHLVVASRSAEARAVGGEVLAMARGLDLRDLEADALGAIGTARVEAGDAGGLADLDAAIASFDELGTPGGIVWHLNLAWAAATLGDLPRCFAALAAGAVRAERFGSLRWRRTIELQRVAERYWTGRWEEAVGIVDDLLAEAERHYLEWECRLWRGRIRLARGRLQEARQDAEAALALAREAGDRQDLDPTRTFLARVLLAAGQHAAARAVADELLAGLGGGMLCPEVGVDLGVVLAELGEQGARLDAIPLPPSPWLEAARAFVAGDPLHAAGVYAAIGSRPDEAAARLAAARRLAAAGRAAAAQAELAAARAFYGSVGATGFLAEAADVERALPGR